MTKTCDWCGQMGHDYTRHPDAVAEAENYREPWDVREDNLLSQCQEG